MSTFSSILDISSFFIGVLVNLLLVAMICFYFKRKIDNLEMSQSEQAKMMFQLIQQQQIPPPPAQTCDTQSCKPSVVGPNVYGMLNGLDLSQLNDDEEEEDNGEVKKEEVEKDSSSSDDDDDDNDDSEDDDSDNDADESDHEDKNENSKDDENNDENENIKKIDYEEIIPEVSVDVEKMTIKELRALLENKGVSVQKKNVKKQELIDIYMKGTEEVVENVVKVDEVIEMNDEGELDISPSEEISE